MQPGSESEKAIKFCKTNNIKTVYNVCFVVDGLKKKLGDQNYNIFMQENNRGRTDKMLV